MLGEGTVVANGYMYVTGGQNTTNYSTVYYASINSDGSTGTWKTTAFLPTSPFKHEMVAANGYIYSIGGNDGSNYLSSVYYAKVNSDGTLNSWTVNTNQLPTLNGYESVVVSNGYIYTIGGHDNSNYLSTVYYTPLARVSIAADLDLLGLTQNGAGINNISGDAGGNIYAGNIYGNNNLTVNGNTTLWNGLSVNGTNSVYQTNSSATASTNILNNINLNATGVVTSGTDTNYASYIQATRTGATGGTINTYGQYINLTTDNAGSGTHTAIGLSVNLDGNADTNYAALFNGGNVGIGTTVASKLFTVGSTGQFTVDSTGNVATSGTFNKVTITQPASGSTLTIADGKTLTVNNSVALSGGDTKTFNFGSNNLTFTTSADTSLTLPTSGTVCTTATCLTSSSGVTTATGTANQVLVNGDTSAHSGAITLTTPQDIGTASNVTFGSVTAGSGNVAITAGALTLNGTTRISNSGVGTFLTGTAIGSLTFTTNNIADSGALTIKSNTSSALTLDSGTTGDVNLGTGASAKNINIGTGAGGNTISIGTDDTTADTINIGSAKDAVTLGGTVNLSSGTASRFVLTDSSRNLVYSGSSSVLASTLTDETGTGHVVFDNTPTLITPVLGVATATSINKVTITAPASSATLTIADGKTLTVNNSLTLTGADSKTWNLGANNLTFSTSADTNLTLPTSGTVCTTATCLTSSSGVTTATGTANQVLVNGDTSAHSGAITLTTPQDIGTSSNVTFGSVTAASIFGGTANNSNLTLQSTSGSGSTDYISFKVGNNGSTEAVRITDNGNVGVGTSTPNYGLDVAQKTAAFNSGKDSSTSTWSSGTVIPISLYKHQSISANGYIYVLGGSTATAPSSSVYSVKINSDGSVGSWVTTSILPESRATGGSFTANGYAYILGGSNGSASQSTVYYSKMNSDGTLGTWTTNVNFLPTIRFGMSTVSANGYAYLIAGNDGGNDRSSVYYAKLNADGTLGTWNLNSNSLPAALIEHSTVIANGYLYVIGGNDNGGARYSSVYYAKLNADGTLGTWNLNSNSLPASRQESAAEVVNGYIYVAGGLTSALVASSTVYVAKVNSDGSVGTWSTNSNYLPAARNYPVSASANGFIYVLGGSSGGSSAQNNSWYASVAKVSIAGDLDLLGLTQSGGAISDSAGNTGGNIYAGSIFSGNNLSVSGNTNLWNGLSVNGTNNIYNSDTSTTASTFTLNNISLNDTGVVTTGTDTNYGSYLNVTRTGATGGTINTYGQYINLTTDNAGAGTHNAYGLYVNLDGNADNNYAAIFNGGNVGIGSTSPTYPVQISSTGADKTNGGILDVNGGLNSTTNNQEAIRSEPTISPGSASSMNYYGGMFVPVSSSSNLASASLVGIAGETYYNGTGTVNASYGGYFVNQLQAAGTISASYGVYIDNPVKAAGTITTNYGLYVNTQSSGSTNYAAIFAGGNVGIGSTAPGSPLVVTTGTTFTTGTLAAFNVPGSTLTGALTGLNVNVSGTTPGTNNVTALSTSAFTGGGNGSTNTGLAIGAVTGSGSSTNNGISIGQVTGGSTRNSNLYITGTTAAAANYAIYSDAAAQSYFAGNVGIGTTSTSALLTVGSTGQLTINSSGNVATSGTFNKVIITAPASSATLTIADGKTLTDNASLTLAGVDGKTLTVNNSLTLTGADSKTWNLGANNLTFTTSADTSLTLPTSGTVCTTATCLTSSSGVTTAQGTANQVLVNSTSGTPTSGAITLTTPQDIGTASNVTFGSVTAASIFGGTANSSSLTLQSTSGSGSTDYISLKVGNNGGTEALRIIDNGNVGVGTSTPAYNLDVYNKTAAFNSSKDGSIGAWNTNTSLPLPVIRSSVAQANGYIYLIGGQVNGSTNSIVYYAKVNSDGTTASYQTTTFLPLRLNKLDSTALNGYIYTIGGSDQATAVQSTVYYARVNSDGTIGSWNTNSNYLPVARTEHTVLSVNGFVYVLAGQDGSNYSSTTYYSKQNADGSLGSWQTSVNALPVAVSFHTSAVANGYMYVIGGNNSSSQRSTVYYSKINADASLGTWNTTTFIPTKLYEHSSASANGYLYLIGGTDGTNTQSTVYYSKVNSDGTLGAWAVSTYLPGKYIDQKSMVINGYIYSLGGNSAGTQSTVYYTPLARVSVGADLDLLGLTQNGGAITSGAGDIGGNIYAGNIYGNNNLSVSGNTTLWNGLSVNGTNSIYNTDTSTTGSTFKSNQITLKDTGVVNSGTDTNYGNYIDVTRTGATGGTINTYGEYINLTTDNAGAGTHTAYGLYVNLDGNADTNYSAIFNGGNVGIGSTAPGSPLVVTTATTFTTGTLASIVSPGSTLTSALTGLNVNVSGTTPGTNNVTAMSTSAFTGGGNGTTNTGLSIGAVTGTGSSTNNGITINTITGGSTRNANLYLTGTSASSTNYALYSDSAANSYFAGNVGIGTTNSASPLYVNSTLSTDGNVGLHDVTTFNPSGAISAQYGAVYDTYFQNSANTINNAYSQFAQALFSGTGGGTAVSNMIGLFARTGISGPSPTGTISNGYDLYLDSIAKNASGSPAVTFNNQYGLIIQDQGFGSGSGGLTVTSAAGAVIADTTSATNKSDLVIGQTNIPTGTYSIYNSSTNNNYFAGNIGLGTTSPAYNLDVYNKTAAFNSGQDGSTGSWSTTTFLPTKREQVFNALAVNGYIYNIGGNDGAASRSSVYYSKIDSNGTLGAWSTNSFSLPIGLSDYSPASSNGYIYITGGSSGGSSVVYYAKVNSDGSTGNWNTNSYSLLENRYAHNTVIANGYLYVIGGRNSGGTYQSTVLYAKLNADGSVGNWINTASNYLPVQRQESASVVANGYVYVIGGYQSSATRSSVYFAKLNADGSLNSWSTTSGLPSTLGSLTAGVANGYVYVIGGWNGSADQSTVYYAKINSDGTLGSWSTNSTSLPAVRDSQATVVANGYLYALGGTNDGGTTILSTVYYSPLARVSVAADLDLLGLTQNGGAISDSAGDIGGNIYAGNIYSGNNLTVSGNTTLWNGLSVNGTNSIYSTDTSTTASTFKSNQITLKDTGVVNSGTDTNYGNYIDITRTGATGGTINTYGEYINLTTDNAGGGSHTAYGLYVNLDGNADTNYAAIFNGGNVGIGSTAPGSPLVVTTGTTFTTGTLAAFNVPASTLTGNLTGMSINVAGTTPGTNSVTGLSIPAFTGGGNGATNYGVNVGALTGSGSSSNYGVYVSTITGGSTRNANIYLTGTSASSANYAIYSDAAAQSYFAGNVGINSTGPAFKLDIASSTANDRGINVTQTATTGTNYGGYYTVNGSGATSNYGLYATVAGATNNYAASFNGGNVGIGSTTPAYGLDVALKTAAFNSGQDGSIGSWSTTSFAPVIISRQSTNTANGYIYTAGGTTAATAVSYSTVYYAEINSDGTTGAWTTTTFLPAGRYAQSSVIYNGYYYILGGYDGSNHQSTAYFSRLNGNGTIGTWLTTTLLPEKKINQGTVVVNGYIYVIGGYNSATTTSTVYYAKLSSDGSIGTWVTTTFLPAKRDQFGITTANGYIYLTGGSDSSNYQSTVYYASVNGDGTTGSWTTTTFLPNRSFGNSVSVSNGYLYVMGGSPGNTSTAYSTVYYAKVNGNGTLGAWNTNVQSLPGSRDFLSSTVVNGYIYAVGGNSDSLNTSTAFSTVYVSSVARVSVGANLDLLGLSQNGGGIPSLNGDVGGSIYAGNIFSNNNLTVTGNTSLWNSLSVNGTNSVFATNPSTIASTFALNSLNLNATGVVTTGTDTNYGNYINVTRTGATGGTINTYGEYINLTTDNAAGGTHNAYGLYANLDSNADANYGIYINGPTASAANYALYSAATAQSYFAGNVGIGSTAPAAKLDVNGTIRMDGATSGYTELKSNSAPTSYTITLPGNAGVNGQVLSTDGSGTLTWQNNGGGATTQWATSGSSITFATGNVGIGTTGTGSQLVVGSTSQFAINSLGQVTFSPSSTAPIGNINNSVSPVAVGSVGTWVTTAFMPGGRNEFTQSPYANGYIYTIGGGDTSGTAQSTSYYAQTNADGSTGSWKTTSFVGTNSRGNGSLALNGYIYSIGGYNGNYQSAVYVAKQNSDGTLGSWTSTTVLPDARYGIALSGINGYVYVIGGQNGAGANQSIVYYAKANSDGTLGSWTSTNYIPGARAVYASSTYNSYIYVVGGQDSAARSTVYYAKPNSDGSITTWTTASTSIPNVLEFLTSTVANGYLYVIGGDTSGTTAQSTVYSSKLGADGSLGSWTNNYLSIKLMRSPGATTANGFIYVTGGNDSGSNAQSTVYVAPVQSTGLAINTSNTFSSGNLLDVWNNLQSKASIDYAGDLQIAGSYNSNLVPTGDGTVGSWTSLTNLPAVREYGSAVTYNGYIYYAGGCINNSGCGTAANLVSTVYVAQTNNSGRIGGWVTTTYLPTLRDGMGMVAYNGYIYLAGGGNATTTLSSVYGIQINADGTLASSFTVNSTHLPAARINHSMTANNGYLYAIGGLDISANRTSTVYYAQANGDGTTGTWKTTTFLTQIRSNLASATYNGYLFIAGGSGPGGSVMSTVWSVPIKSDGTIGATWTALTSLPNANGFQTSMVAYNGYLYIFGGSDNAPTQRSSVYSAPIKADGTIGPWSTLTSLAAVQGEGVSTVNANGYVYVLGGFVGANSTVVSSTVYSAPISQSRAFVFNTLNNQPADSAPTIGGAANIFTVQNNGGAVFNVDSGGNAKFAGTLSASNVEIGGSSVGDLAENMTASDNTLAAADVVSLDGFGRLIKSFEPYDAKVVGVISTNPSITLSPEADGKPVALSGRVPVKIATDSASIQPGDYLTATEGGYAMKATRAGQMIGKALETWAPGSGKDRILTLLNLTQADPNSLLAQISLDADGKLIIPELKVGKLTLDPSLALDTTEATGAGTLAYQITNLDHRVRDLENGVVNISGPTFAETMTNLASAEANTQNLIASQGQRIDQIASDSASLHQNIASVEYKADSLASSVASTSATLASLQDTINNFLGSSNFGSSSQPLTPPDILTATGSAQLAHLNVTDQISTLKLDAQEATIAANFKVTGDTQLASTNIAGDIVQDGTLSITNGNTIDVQGPLHVQTNFLAQAVDFFNGLITLTKEGEVKANSVIVAEYKVTSGTTTGSGVIKAGTSSVDIDNAYIESGSHILITPTTNTSQVLAVTQKIAGQSASASASARLGKFTVSSPSNTTADTSFDYWIINEEAP